jgi:hypothetical protein
MYPLLMPVNMDWVATASSWLKPGTLTFPFISGFRHCSTTWSTSQPPTTFSLPLRHPLIPVYPHNLSFLLALTAPQLLAGYIIPVLMTASLTPLPSTFWWPKPPPSSSWTSLLNVVQSVLEVLLHCLNCNFAIYFLYCTVRTRGVQTIKCFVTKHILASKKAPDWAIILYK